MFLPRHKVVFIHIPKCGGTSIEQSLIRAGGYESFPPEELLLYKNRKPWKGPPSVGHLAANQYVSKGYLARSDWDNSFKFTVVRNPFSRLVSAYNYRGVSWRARIRGKSKWSFREFVFDYFPQWFDDNHLHGHDNWTHVRPMADLLCNKEGELLVDYVGRLENLKESFAEICRLSGLPEDSKLLHSNPSRVRNPDTGELLEAGVKIPWKDYYDKETVGFVQRYYSKDFELFDYPNTF